MFGAAKLRIERIAGGMHCGWLWASQHRVWRMRFGHGRRPPLPRALDDVSGVGHIGRSGRRRHGSIFWMGRFVTFNASPAVGALPCWYLRDPGGWICSPCTTLLP